VNTIVATGSHDRARSAGKLYTRTAPIHVWYRQRRRLRNYTIKQHTTIAGSHPLDETTGEYNIIDRPRTRIYWPRIGVANSVALLPWQSTKSFRETSRDLNQPGVKLVNRQKRFKTSPLSIWHLQSNTVSYLSRSPVTITKSSRIWCSCCRLPERRRNCLVCACCSTRAQS